MIQIFAGKYLLGIYTLLTGYIAKLKTKKNIGGQWAYY